MTSNINFFSLTNYIKSIEKELIENGVEELYLRIDDEPSVIIFVKEDILPKLNNYWKEKRQKIRQYGACYVSTSTKNDKILNRKYVVKTHVKFI